MEPHVAPRRAQRECSGRSAPRVPRLIAPSFLAHPESSPVALLIVVAAGRLLQRYPSSGPFAPTRHDLAAAIGIVGWRRGGRPRRRRRPRQTTNRDASSTTILVCAFDCRPRGWSPHRRPRQQLDFLLRHSLSAQYELLSNVLATRERTAFSISDLWSPLFAYAFRSSELFSSHVWRTRVSSTTSGFSGVTGSTGSPSCHTVSAGLS